MRNSGAICNFHPSAANQISELFGAKSVNLCATQSAVKFDDTGRAYGPFRATSRWCLRALLSVCIPYLRVITTFFTTAIPRAEFLKNPVVYLATRIPGNNGRRIPAKKSARPYGESNNKFMKIPCARKYARQSKYNSPFLAAFNLLRRGICIGER